MTCWSDPATSRLLRDCQTCLAVQFLISLLPTCFQTCSITLRQLKPSTSSGSWATFFLDLTTFVESSLDVTQPSISCFNWTVSKWQCNMESDQFPLNGYFNLSAANNIRSCFPASHGVTGKVSQLLRMTLEENYKRSGKGKMLLLLKKGPFCIPEIRLLEFNRMLLNKNWHNFCAGTAQKTRTHFEHQLRTFSEPDSWQSMCRCGKSHQWYVSDFHIYFHLMQQQRHKREFA